MKNFILLGDANCVSVGNLTVKKKDELKEFRDGLIKLGFYENSSELVTFGELFEKCYYCDVNAEAFISKVPIDFEYKDGEEVVTYRKNVIKNRYTDVILIFSSLLGDIKSEDYDQRITKYFIKSGIFAIKPLDEIWDMCIERIVNRNKKCLEKTGNFSPDYIALRMAFDEGVIQYNAVDTLTYKEACDNRLLSGTTLDNLKRIVRDSNIIFGKNNKRYSRKRNSY